MTHDPGKYDVKLDSNEGLEELLSFLRKKSVDFLPESRERIVRRLRFMSRRYGYRNFTDLLDLIKSDEYTLNDLITWLERGREYQESSNTFTPLVKKPKRKKKERRKEKRTKRILITELPAALGFVPDPIDKSNINLIYNFLASKQINYEAYKEKYFLRRLHVRMRRTGSLTYREYSSVLNQDATEIHKLVSNLSINVTRFFRDSDLFEKLEKDIIPQLFRTGDGSIRIWSAGCAIGAEPYSIAILISHLYKQSGLNKTNILATDVNSDFLMEARKGIFHRMLLKNTKPILTHTYFRLKEKDKFQISPTIQEAVKFQVHDLRDPPPGNKFDLILCRIVLIYFSRAQANKLFEHFNNILTPKGYLVLGKCELIPSPIRSKFKVVHSRTRIYQLKKSD